MAALEIPKPDDAPPDGPDVPDPDPTTEELRVEQLQREVREREQRDSSLDADEADQHERRADKAGYLREKLEQRAQSEREAAKGDRPG